MVYRTGTGTVCCPCVYLVVYCALSVARVYCISGGVLCTVCCPCVYLLVYCVLCRLAEEANVDCGQLSALSVARVYICWTLVYCVGSLERPLMTVGSSVHCLLPVCISDGVLCRLAGEATNDCGNRRAL